MESNSEIVLKEHNYDTHEDCVVGKVSVYTLVRSISIKQFAYFLSEFLNCGMKDQSTGAEIGKIFHSEHRTLQASAIRFCMGFLIAISKQEYTDARNEVPVAMCKKIAKMVEDGELKMGWMI